MTRISNKDKALAYAAEHGIILTVEDDMSVFDIYTVEVWSLRAHLSETGSDCHTYFAHGTTEPRAWVDALAYMERLTDCPADCSCNDQGQDDTDQDQDQDNTLSKSNEFKARELAAQRGITITTDCNDRGAIIRINLDGPYMALRGYSCSYSGNTVPQLWASIIRELETIPSEDTCHTCGTIVPTSYINRDGCARQGCCL